MIKLDLVLNNFIFSWSSSHLFYYEDSDGIFMVQKTIMDSSVLLFHVGQSFANSSLMPMDILWLVAGGHLLFCVSGSILSIPLACESQSIKSIINFKTQNLTHSRQKCNIQS